MEAVKLPCIDRTIPLAPVLAGVGVACVAGMLAVGILATQGRITSVRLIGGATLSCGLVGTGSLLTTLFIGGAKKLSNTRVIALTALLSATAIAVALVGVATLKGGYGMQLTRPLSQSAGIGTTILGSGLLVFGGWAYFAGGTGFKCYRA